MRYLGAVWGSVWATAGSVVLIAGWVGPGSEAWAADECGLIAAVVNCVGPGGNPYATGISYDSVAAGGLELNVGSDITITRPPMVDGSNGIGITGTGPLTANLASGVTITTSGLDSNGVRLYGNGALTITSAANITIAVPDPVGGVVPENASSGLLAWNPIAGTGTGDIRITQLANSTIIASGNDGGGVYGLNYGFGSIVLDAWGAITTDGDDGDGVLANNGNGNGADTTVNLHAGSVILTKGTNSAAGYSLNAGTGSAVLSASGKITTLGAGTSYGVLSVVDNVASISESRVTLTSSAIIDTFGDGGRGAWAYNKGFGTATLTSKAQVTTRGLDAFGLYTRIENRNSTAEAKLVLETGGNVTTGGVTAHGLYGNNKGDGATTIVMQTGTTVTTTGAQASGVYGLSGLDGLLGTTVTFDQDAGSSVTVSGVEAFGVNLDGNTVASANIRGPVTASGNFGVGVSAYSNTGVANIDIAANTTVTGGWQDILGSLGPNTIRPSAGILIGGATSQLTNRGTIVAASDRAIADIGRQIAKAGNLTVDNSGRVTGFVELAAGGANVFNNAALFDLRHFADTNGDGVRDTKRVSISDFGGAGSSFNNAAGATVRLAPVASAATTDPASYYVPTTGNNRALETSNYALTRAGIVQGQFLNLATFNNSGIIDLRGPATGNTLVMTGDRVAGGAVAGNGLFTANGGSLLLNTFFNAGIPLGGQTGSLSDVLVLDSTALGAAPTGITIDRRQGPGAVTPGNGILVVEVRNKGASVAGVFALNGDFVQAGQQLVVGGAHAYGLFHNGVDVDIADGNWYLRNQGLSPIVPIYEEYPKVLLPLIDLPTLQQRIGNRQWNSQQAAREPQTVFCKDPAQNYRCVVTDVQASYYLDESGTVVAPTDGIWGRIQGGYGHYVPPLSTIGARYDSTIWGLQAGIDSVLADGEDGTLVAGLNLNYGRTSADITAPGSAGNITSSGYGLGGTLTWYGASGFYVDAQAQLTWLDSQLASLTTGRSLVDGHRGFGQSFSLEVGQRVGLDQHWTLTPQAQLTYANVGFDSFTDVYGTSVSLLQGQSLQGRLGLAAEYQSSWKAEDGTVSRLSTYGIANLEKELLDGTRVSVSGYEFASGDNGLWGGIGLGGSYNWDDDKYSVYGEVSAKTGLERFGDSYELGGTIGLRVKW